MSPMECMKRIVACDNGRDAAGYRALLHEDYQAIVHGQVQHVGREVEVEALSSWWRATSDVHLEIVEIAESGGLVTLRYTLEGTHDGPLGELPASGRRFRVENCTLLRVVEGRAKVAYRYADTLGLMTQLGAIPARG